MRKNSINKIAKRLKDETVVPFWMWNDRLITSKLIEQLQNIKSKGINQVVIHPRVGLETPYLSDEWFAAFGAVLEEAKKQKMGIWIYDELNWPSGYAGGKILAQYPNLQAQHLVKTEQGFKVRKTSWKTAYSKLPYVDILNSKTGEVFINNVHHQYWLRFKRDFGETILGFFTDEPGLYNNFSGSDPKSLPWSENLPTFFKKEFGYDLEDALPLIWEGKNQKSIQARIDFWDAISRLYQQNYFKKINDWCHRHNVALIGHILAEESMVDTAKTQGNFFSAMKYLDFAGYDLLDRLTIKTIIPASLAKSASKLHGLRGVVAETFGIFGWDLTLKEMQRVASWQIKMGLDVLIPHALYYSVKGKRYNDCPPSLFAEKYWDTFDNFVEYVRNLKRGYERERTQVAIYYPIETVWGKLLPEDSSEAEQVDKIFRAVSFACYNNQINFDYINSEYILKKDLNEYKYLILPQTEILPLEVIKKIFLFTKKGGVVITVGNFPTTATKLKDQNSFLPLSKEANDLFYNFTLPADFWNQKKDTKIKMFIKNALLKRLSLVWIVRIKHMARLVGSESKIDLKQQTGLENQLKQLISKAG